MDTKDKVAVNETKHPEVMTALDLLRPMGIPPNATQVDIIRFQNDAIKILKRDNDHVTIAMSSMDNQLRSYWRKNLPRNPNGATTDEVELIYAEQRFITSAMNCSELIQSINSERVVEFKLAIENLEKARKEIMKKHPDYKL